MKKLMIAMSAAAMAALCAQAGIPKGYTSGIDFENTATGNLNVLLDDTNTQQGTDNTQQGTDLKYWASAAASKEEGTTGQVESQIVDGSQIEGSKNTGKFLKVDETVPLQRSMAGVDADGIPTSTPVGDGIEISSRVQFTAADTAPTPGDGDKLLVWMRAADAEKNLPAAVMVTSKGAETAIKTIVGDEEKGVTDEQAVEAFTADWHTLVIKAEAKGSGLTKTSSFTVTLDNETAGPFESLVTGGDAAQTISSIGFQGTGAVDDIGFKTLAAADPVVVTLSLGEGVNLVDAAQNPIVGTTISGIPGKTVTVYAEGAAAEYTVSEGAVVTDGEGEFDGFAVITITVAKDLTVTITKGESPTPPTPIQPSINPAAGESTITIRAATSSVAEEQAIAAITAPSGVDAAKYKTYFMATAVAAQDGSYTVTVGLNPDVVTPAVVDNANLDIAAGAITVSSKVGLYYSLVKGTTLSTITNVVDTQAGTGEVLKLVDSTTKGDAAFYRVSVTAVTPATTETTEE